MAGWRTLGITACLLSLAAACVGRIGGEGERGSGAPEGDVPANGLRRLSAYEYDNTVRDLLFDDSGGAALNLPADLRTPFDNDYQSQDVSQALIEGVELLAGDAAERLLADHARRERIVGCTPAGVRDEACFTSFLESFGRRALRRPLHAEEIAARMALLDFAVEAGDFYFAVDLAVRSFLQDPAFLYRVENGEEVASGIVRLDAWSLASRLSYLIWATMPDDDLFAAAASGALGSSEALHARAETMLRDERALVQIERFHALWMGYEGLLSAEGLVPDMRAETTALFEKVIGEGRPWRDLLLWPETYVTPELAAHYDLDAPANGSGWAGYQSGRGGLLAHASFLAIGGQGEVTSPTDRGRLIRELLLCQTIPPPPATVNPSFGNTEGAVCKKDKYAAHSQGGCATCHALMDGIGFGLEHYDATGKFRLNEPDDAATDQVDESECELPSGGELVEGETRTPFEGPGELGALLAESDALSACLARQFYRFALGRSELDVIDERLVSAMLAGIVEQRDFRFDALVLELVRHESFRYRRVED